MSKIRVLVIIALVLCAGALVVHQRSDSVTPQAGDPEQRPAHAPEPVLLELAGGETIRVELAPADQPDALRAPVSPGGMAQQDDEARLGSLSGGIWDSRGEPVAGHSLLLETAPQGGITPSFHVTTDEDGMFAIPKLPAGHYEVLYLGQRSRADPDGGKRVAPTEVLHGQNTRYFLDLPGERSLTGAFLFFDPSIDGFPLVVELSPAHQPEQVVAQAKVATIHGGQPLDEGAKDDEYEDGDPRRFRRNGYFHFSALEPGEYLLSVWPDTGDDVLEPHAVTRRIDLFEEDVSLPPRWLSAESFGITIKRLP